MPTMTTADVKEAFTDTINRVGHNKERIILTRRGKEVAAIIPMEDLRVLEAFQNKNDVEEAIEALKEARDIGMVSLEDLKEELGK